MGFPASIRVRRTNPSTATGQALTTTESNKPHSWEVQCSHWFKKSTKFVNMWCADVRWGTGTTTRDCITFQREAGGTDNRESKSPRVNRIKGGIRGEMSLREEDATHQTHGDLACVQAGWGTGSGWWYTVAGTVGAMLFKTWVVWRQWAAPVQHASHECKSASGLIFKSDGLNTQACEGDPILLCPHKEVHCSLLGLEVIHIRLQHS